MDFFTFKFLKHNKRTKLPLETKFLWLTYLVFSLCFFYYYNQVEWEQFDLLL